MSYNKPLEGIKIVEISTIVTASLATMMMADQGAEVIKIEQSGIGDPMRYLGTQKVGCLHYLLTATEAKDLLI